MQLYCSYGQRIDSVIIKIIKKIWTHTYKTIQLRDFQQILVVMMLARLINLPTSNLFCLRPIRIKLRIRGIFAQITIHTKI